MPSLLQDYLTRSAERSPEAVALAMGGQSVNYGELDERSNQLARLLRDAGCRQGDRVCFLIPKSPLAITCMLAILKADCMHIPLDPAGPAARIARIVRSCRPQLLLAGGTARAIVRELWCLGCLRDVPIAWVDPFEVPNNLPLRFCHSDLAAYSASPLVYRSGPHSPSHIFFTSGSTGVPKGVVITHSNVVHFVEWATTYFEMMPFDRVSGHSPLHFDLSQFDIFGAFALGAALHLVPPHLNLLANRVAEFIRRSELTQWFSVPSILHYMARFDVISQGDFPRLKRLLWCGDTLATPILIYYMKRLPHVSFTNLYGPTETTIASSYYTIPACPSDEQAPVPIGSPCDQEELLVLDEQLNRAPDGEIGNLYIRGAGLSPGYWEDPEMTRQAFLPNPHGHSAGDRLYRTGDLARVGEDGLVYFLGRADSQIKSRGYRIELGEIEAAINTLEFIRECVVVAVPSSGFEGAVICCAYSTVNGAVPPATLRTRLSGLLPSYMLPSQWLAMKTLPKNSNGKIDRMKLRGEFEHMNTSATPAKTA